MSHVIEVLKSADIPTEVVDKADGTHEIRKKRKKHKITWVGGYKAPRRYARYGYAHQHGE
jgi:hypothetical protein